MPWVKLDEGFAEHGKVVGLSDAAFRAYVTALCYCGRRENNGSIPAGAVKMLGGARRFTDLVDAGLMERDGENYVVHDYLDYNPSKEELDEMREKKRRAGSAGGKQSASTRSSKTQAPATAPAQAESNPDPDPDPIPEERGARAQSSPSRRGRATVVDDEYRAQMCEQFADTWGPDRVNAIIDDAMGHKAAAKRTDLRAYVRNWLSSEKERKPMNGRSTSVAGRPTGMPQPYVEAQ
jgi:hypothetical protein